MARTAVALYDDATAAYATVDDLIEGGIAADEISTVTGEAAAPAELAPRATSGPLGAGPTDPRGLADDLDRLGVPRSEAEYYADGVRRGGALVVVRTADDDAERAADIMGRRPVSAYEGAGRGRVGTGGEEAVPIMEEQLDVHKRAVERGRVRIHTHVEERPVERTVRLRDEQVRVERRPVDRPVTASEDAFKERTIEVSEVDEEAVVEKEARIVEEVVVSKDAVEHEETVRDTVRRTEVEVEDTTTGQRTGGPRRDRT